jgi:putative SOS response-associated peptidase YedK
MCGRYSLTTPVEALRRLFGFAELPNLAPRYNIAPTQDVPVVRFGPDDARHLGLLRWGLIPSWARDRAMGNRLINARAEGVATTPAFRAAFKSRRCLVPADGFYEWRTENGIRQPWRITLGDGGPFAFAGLWEAWRDPASGQVVESFAIITTDANALVKPIHDRMPVILDPQDYDRWLTASATDPGLGLLRPCAADRLRAYRVDPIVNNPRNDDPACLVEKPAAPSGQAVLL